MRSRRGLRPRTQTRASESAFSFAARVRERYGLARRRVRSAGGALLRSRPITPGAHRVTLVDARRYSHVTHAHPRTSLHLALTVTNTDASPHTQVAPEAPGVARPLSMVIARAMTVNVGGTRTSRARTNTDASAHTPVAPMAPGVARRLSLVIARTRVAQQRGTIVPLATPPAATPIPISADHRRLPLIYREQPPAAPQPTSAHALDRRHAFAPDDAASTFGAFDAQRAPNTPPIDVVGVADHVLRTIEDRLIAHRERRGRV